MKVERAPMRTWYAILSVILIHLAAHAQRPTVEIIVLDSLEGGPVSSVSVAWSEGGQAFGLLTDERGRCLLPVSDDRVTVLTVSRSGYHTRSVRVVWRDVPAEGVIIRLAAVELPPVEVTRPKPELIFQRPDLHAADLLINDEGIWVLAYARPRMLRGESEAGQELLRDVRLVLLDSTLREYASCPVPEDVKGLRRDLRNTVLIEGTTRAFAVVRTEDDIQLAPFGLEELRAQVLPWTDSIPGRVIGHASDGILPTVDHLAFEPLLDSVDLVCTVIDSFMLSLFRSEYRHLKGPEKVVAMNLAAELGVDKEIVAGYMSGFRHHIWFKPVYAPLFVVGDTLLVFDHPSGRLRKFTRDLKEATAVPVSYLGRAEGRDRAVRIVQDRRSGDLYAVFQRNGYQWLRAIDPIRGELGKRTRLTYRYPERTQVFDGKVYYVYRPFESLQKRSIYRERMAE